MNPAPYLLWKIFSIKLLNALPPPHANLPTTCFLKLFTAFKAVEYKNELKQSEFDLYAKTMS